jgi:hypothetical protein
MLTPQTLVPLNASLLACHWVQLGLQLGSVTLVLVTLQQCNSRSISAAQCVLTGSILLSRTSSQRSLQNSSRALGPSLSCRRMTQCVRTREVQSEGCQTISSEQVCVCVGGGEGECEHDNVCVESENAVLKPGGGGKEGASKE